MWTELLNESRTSRKFQNKTLLILGSKHSGKRSLFDSLLDFSKTTKHNKKLQAQAEGSKMRLKGLTTAIDYAYLNVIDEADPDNRTHSKLEAYMIQEPDNMAVFADLALPQIVKQCMAVIMLDFTSPWNFITELEKWVKFLYELQCMAKLAIGDLEEMSARQEEYYRKYKEPELDESGKLKTALAGEVQQEISIPIPEGVLQHNMRVPLLVCVNKSDLQSQVLREESVNKLVLILYHLRTFCAKAGASLLYTSVRNNSNVDKLYEYILHRTYCMHLKHKADLINEEAIFVPFGADNLSLIKDSVVKIDVEKPYSDAISQPVVKKNLREEITIEDDSEYFKKYISTMQSAGSSVPEPEKPAVQRQPTDVKVFFQALLATGSNRTSNTDHTQRLLNAERELMRHTNQAMGNSTASQNSSSAGTANTE